MTNAKEVKDEELSNVTGGLFDEKDNNYTLVIKDYLCPKDRIIILVKEITGVGYKEAKELVDSLPKTILEHLSKEKADKLVNKLLENNIDAEIIIR